MRAIMARRELMPVELSWLRNGFMKADGREMRNKFADSRSTWSRGSCERGCGIESGTMGFGIERQRERERELNFGVLMRWWVNCKEGSKT